MENVYADGNNLEGRGENVEKSYQVLDKTKEGVQNTQGGSDFIEEK